MGAVYGHRSHRRQLNRLAQNQWREIAVWREIASPSTIQELDEVVEKFMIDGRNPSYLSVASSLAEEYKVDAKAAMYTRIMQKVVDKGVGYVNTEIQRVHKLLSGPVVETKREELESKIKVLNVFSQSEEL